MRNIISIIGIVFFQKSTLLFFAAWIVLFVMRKVTRQEKLKVFSNFFLGLFLVTSFFWLWINQLPVCDSTTGGGMIQMTTCECQGIKINNENLITSQMVGGDSGNKCLGIVKSSKKIEWWKNFGNQF